MKKLSRLALAALVGAMLLPAGTALAAKDAPLEGQAALGSSTTNMYAPIKDTKRHLRDYVQQPPLVPHDIAKYEVSRNFNKCMDCHSAERYVEMNATRVPVSHFQTRGGNVLSNLSPSRYFCAQCHVPQVDAKPLLGNEYKSGSRK